MGPLLTRHTYLCLLSPDHASLTAGRELMDGRQPAAEVMLLLFFPNPWRLDWSFPYFLLVTVQHSSHGFKRHLKHVIALKDPFLFFFFTQQTPHTIGLSILLLNYPPSLPFAFPLGNYPPFLHFFLLLLFVCGASIPADFRRRCSLLASRHSPAMAHIKSA